MQNTNDPTKNGTEVTLRSIVLKLQEYVQEIWRFKFLFILVVALFVGLALFRHFVLLPLEYQAKLTYMVNEEGSKANAFSPIFNLVGGEGDQNLQKIVALSRTFKIVSPALLDSAEVDGINDLMANHAIRILALHEKWQNNSDLPALHNYQFSKTTDLDLVGNIALKSIFFHIIGSEDTEGVMTSEFNEDTGILSLSAKSESQDFSRRLVNMVYTNLSNYYILQKVSPQQQTLRTIENKVDSLMGLIRAKELALARFEDTKRNLIYETNKLKKNQLQNEIRVLYQAYGKALENREQADFILKTNTPVFNVVDYPLTPLAPIEKSLLLSIIIAIILGAFLVGAFVILRKMYMDAMYEG